MVCTLFVSLRRQNESSHVLVRVTGVIPSLFLPRSPYPFLVLGTTPSAVSRRFCVQHWLSELIHIVGRGSGLSWSVVLELLHAFSFGSGFLC